MCYSPEVDNDLKKLRKTERAKVDLAAFEAIFAIRMEQELELPKALEANFNLPRTPQERRIRDLIEAYREQQAVVHNDGILKQSERLALAEAKLALKHTKTASESRRIATKKLAWHRFKLEDLVRVERLARDNRAFPKWFVPVIVQEGATRVIRPMRYLCRPENMPEMVWEKGRYLPFDVARSGCYNARRDNIEYFWKAQFGVKHAYMVIYSFYEHVERHRYEGREKQPGDDENGLIIRFKPKTGEIMKAACLWSEVQQTNLGLIQTVAAVTDDPPPEVSAAGHDRCLIPLTETSLEYWLRPDRNKLPEQQAALDNRVRSYYEHQLAA